MYFFNQTAESTLINSSNEMQSITSTVKICSFYLREISDLKENRQHQFNCSSFSTYLNNYEETYKKLEQLCLTHWSNLCLQNNLKGEYTLNSGK